MESDSKALAKRAQLVDVARAMLDAENDLIEGARLICRLRFYVDDPDDPVFLPIRGFESETDDFPTRGGRAVWALEALQRMDKDVERYVQASRESIRQACRKIIEKFSVP